MNLDNKKSDLDILSVKKLLSKKNLKIPEYQRPYRWKKETVVQLLEDIKSSMDKQYRI